MDEIYTSSKKKDVWAVRVKVHNYMEVDDKIHILVFGGRSHQLAKRYTVSLIKRLTEKIRDELKATIF